MKVVRFLMGHLMYQPGETAGFADAVADTLIAAGIAQDEEAAAAEADARAAEEAAAAEAGAKAAEEAAAAEVPAKTGKRG